MSNGVRDERRRVVPIREGVPQRKMAEPEALHLEVFPPRPGVAQILGVGQALAVLVHLDDFDQEIQPRFAITINSSKLP